MTGDDHREKNLVVRIPQEVRVAVTVKDLAKVRELFQEIFGLAIQQEWQNEEGAWGAGVILKLENATLELLDEPQTELVEQVEAARSAQKAGGVRLALEFENIEEVGEQLTHQGFTPVNAPVTTPWNHYNWRFQVDEKLQLTLFQVLD
jgi:catechol 2,3-dioxygenase-like lactoylglutathione lyase family enzyme